MTADSAPTDDPGEIRYAAWHGGAVDSEPELNLPTAVAVVGWVIAGLLAVLAVALLAVCFVWAIVHVGRAI